MALPVERINSKFEGEIEYGRNVFGAPYALPGDLVQFSLRRGKKKSFKVCHIERADSYPSDLALTKPFCEYYEKCGGCRGQHLDYNFQMDLKCGPVEKNMLEKFNITVDRFKAPKQFAHRHRMDFVVDGDVIGQRPAGDFSKFISLQSCAVQGESANRALKIMQELILEFPDIPFHRQSQNGTLKYVTIRSNNNSGLIILTLLEDYQSHTDFKNFIDALLTKSKEQLPEFGIVACKSDSKSEVSAPPGGQALHNNDVYREDLGNLQFKVPYDSFFQPNPQAFDLLLEQVFETMDPLFTHAPKKEGLVDLYCGNAVLSAIFSNRYKDSFAKISGFEFTKSATLQAPENLQHFDGSIEFHESDLNKTSDKLIQSLEEKNNLILIDPPRAGISPVLKEKLIEIKDTDYMLYISCNPQSQIKDLEVLTQSWEIVSACLVDCYPQTPHLEQAVFLKYRR